MLKNTNILWLLIFQKVKNAKIFVFLEVKHKLKWYWLINGPNKDAKVIYNFQTVDNNKIVFRKIRVASYMFYKSRFFISIIILIL